MIWRDSWLPRRMVIRSRYRTFSATSRLAVSTEWYLAAGARRQCEHLLQVRCFVQLLLAGEAGGTRHWGGAAAFQPPRHAQCPCELPSQVVCRAAQAACETNNSQELNRAKGQRGAKHAAAPAVYIVAHEKVVGVGALSTDAAQLQ